MKEVAAPSGKIEIPFIKGTAGPYIHSFSKGRPLLPVNTNSLYERVGRTTREIHISFIQGAAAPSSKIEIPLGSEAARKLSISFMKGAAAASPKIGIPFLKEAAGPLEKMR